MKDRTPRNRDEEYFDRQIHQRNQDQRMSLLNRSLRLNQCIASPASQPRMRQIQDPAILQISESFDENGNQPPDAFMFADVYKIIEERLFPEIR